MVLFFFFSEADPKSKLDLEMSLSESGKTTGGYAVSQPKPVTEPLHFNGFMLGHIVRPPYVKGYVSILSLKIEEIVKSMQKSLY